MSSLEWWRSDGGDEYTDRQEHLDTGATLRHILGPTVITIKTALEVGCNRGDNLAGLPHSIKAEGVEPNDKARFQAQARGLTVVDGTAQDLPYPNDWFDLVFTCGVLIHIPPTELGQALDEIHRVAWEFILAVEYYAPRPTPVDYRGVRNGIWKRDYGSEYRRRFPGLELVASGLESEMGGTPYEGASWWLLAKP